MRETSRAGPVRRCRGRSGSLGVLSQPPRASAHRRVPPGEFIPLAEACGLIDSIGEWVVREGCRQARAWQLEGLPHLRVAVNLSAFQFRSGNLLQTIREAL